MAKDRKGKKEERFATPFEALASIKLPDAKAAKAAPRPASRAQVPKTKATPKGDYADRVAFEQAFAGVKPLGGAERAERTRPLASRAPKAQPIDGRVDDQARGRLAAWVSDGLRFVVERDEAWVQARRHDSPAAEVAALKQGRARPEAEIDLHGLHADEARKALSAFVRRACQESRRIVCVIHGRGLHSEGQPVLADCVFEELTKGASAPFVLALVTTAQNQGGAGALLVRLRR